MATPVERQAIEVLSEEFANRPPEGFNSAAVYNRLRIEDVDIPDYALARLWTKLQRNGFIAGSKALGGDEIAERHHGNWYIQWVHPNILD
jgi:hypothetical protein